MVEGGNVAESTITFNKALVLELIETMDKCLESGNFEALEKYYALDIETHTHLVPDKEPQESEGKTPFEVRKAALVAARASFGERTHKVVQQIAEGDLVMTRTEVTLKHTGEFAGMAPTGKVVHANQIQIYRILGDQVVESWVFGDALDLLLQLGATVSPGTTDRI